MTALEALTLLGLPSDATQAQIKSTYRRLAQATHPDRGGDELSFARLNKAYKVALGEAPVKARCVECGGKGFNLLMRGFQQLKMPCQGCGGTGVL